MPGPALVVSHELESEPEPKRRAANGSTEAAANKAAHDGAARNRVAAARAAAKETKAAKNAARGAKRAAAATGDDARMDERSESGSEVTTQTRIRVKRTQIREPAFSLFTGQ